MNKEIMVACMVNSDNVDIAVIYYITLDDNIQTICCKVGRENHAIPLWLNVRKFEFKSKLVNGTYMPLYSDTLNASEHAILFMDLVYTMIMKREHLKVA